MRRRRQRLLGVGVGLKSLAPMHAAGPTKRQQTNNKQTTVARHDDCAGVMHSELIR